MSSKNHAEKCMLSNVNNLTSGSVFLLPYSHSHERLFVVSVL